MSTPAARPAVITRAVRNKRKCVTTVAGLDTGFESAATSNIGDALEAVLVGEVLAGRRDDTFVETGGLCGPEVEARLLAIAGNSSRISAPT